MLDVDGEARWLLGDPYRIPGARELAREHLGPGSVVQVPRLIGGDAALFRLEDHHRIAIRAGLDPVRERWAIMHEVAEWHLARIGYCEPDVELVAEALAAALVAPREPYLRELAAARGRWAPVARAFATSQTCVALRLGEATGQPIAVVTPAIVRVRGDEWGWPREPEIRALAKAKRLPLEVRRVALTDDRRRRALLGAA